MNRPAPAPLAAVAALAASAALLAPPPAAAQTAREVLDRALEEHRSQTEGIENYTLVQSVMGFETTTYFERRTVDGKSVLVPAATHGSEAGERVPQNPYRLYAQLGERATLEGRTEVDGETCHVIEVTDFSGTDLSSMGPGAGGDWTPERMQLLVDTDEHLLRRMTLEGTTSGGDAASFTVNMEDYRTVEGFSHPFRMQVSAEGFGGQMSEQERRQLRQNLEKMREKMEQMPAQQRKMMERMMGGKMEKMEKMLLSGTMDFTVEVKELRVNEGPPGEGAGGGS